MFDLLFITSIIGSTVRVIKEANTKTVPAENWANKELYYKDIADGIPVKQRLKNLENGKYKLTEDYQKPHKDPNNGKIMIENSKLFHEDLVKYGKYKVYHWKKQGKYNL